MQKNVLIMMMMLLLLSLKCLLNVFLSHHLVIFIKILVLVLFHSFYSLISHLISTLSHSQITMKSTYLQRNECRKEEARRIKTTTTTTTTTTTFQEVITNSIMSLISMDLLKSVNQSINQYI
uniref:SJCHGC02858 protein n=1 Tax=Schistosoma japonicum TaxID=6182 RepID=Q5D8Y3_SCHJA|nr:SJCHGC02858 protein [Schistosoma japonicum]